MDCKDWFLKEIRMFQNNGGSIREYNNYNIFYIRSYFFIFTDLCITFLEGIANQWRWAAAKWAVIDRLTHCLATTHILRARIFTFTLYASFVAWTIRTKDALWMTTSYTRWNTLQTRQTFANCRIANFLADGIRTAW